jgi:hypothetical protein
MTTILSLLTNIIDIINQVIVPFVFALAFLMFLIGIVRGFFLNPGDQKARDAGKQFAMWAIVAFFVMFSVWGLVNVLFFSFGLNNLVRPAIPTFGNSAVSGAQSMPNSSPSMFGGSSNTTVNTPAPAISNNGCPSGYSDSLDGQGCVKDSAPATSSNCPAGMVDLHDGQGCQ